jgi:hypothetical protein
MRETRRRTMVGVEGGCEEERETRSVCFLVVVYFVLGSRDSGCQNGFSAT